MPRIPFLHTQVSHSVVEIPRQKKIKFIYCVFIRLRKSSSRHRHSYMRRVENDNNEDEFINSFSSYTHHTQQCMVEEGRRNSLECLSLSRDDRAYKCMHVARNWKFMKTENLNNLPIELHHEIFNHMHIRRTHAVVVNVMQYQFFFLNVALFWVEQREEKSRAATVAVISSLIERARALRGKNEKQVHWQRSI